MSLSDAEMASLKEVAVREGFTLSECVRRSLRLSSRLAAIRVAADHTFPTADVNVVLDEIELGYAL